MLLDPDVWAIMTTSKLFVHDADAASKISEAAWDHLCANCAAASRQSIEDARMKIWEMLPGLFDLPERSALEAQSKDA